jgi:DNA-binding response OmpR family regulator
MITARGEEIDRVVGLELGADDYLTKPIYLKEVLTRLKLLLEKKEREKIEMGVTQAKLAGSLSDIGLVDLIQTLEMGNKSAGVQLLKR